MEDNGEDKDEAKRRTRNLSEKKRRDQFILLINELSTMVSSNSRKMDKCTVLKATISFLRNHNEITVRSRAHDIREEWKPTFLSNEEFTYLVLEALEGFVMVISTSGPIYYVSESITTLLGYDPVDILNKNIFEMIYEEEHGNMYNILHNGPTIDQAQEREGEISFQCHFKRAREIGDLTSDVIFYELIQFNGRFRPTIEQVRSNDSQSYQNREAGKLFVCTGRLCTPQLIKDVSLVDTNRNEFTSRHSLEWKFLFLDHRAPPIIGYLPFEVLGTSGYDYYHFDDLEKVTHCHELLMTKGDITSCYYRFLTKGQQWIWLQSRFYISYHQWNSKPEFVVCTHRVVSHADMEQSMKQENDVERSSHLNNSQESMKEDTNEDTLSNQYMADRSTYANNYCDVSQGCSRKLTSSADSTVETIATTGSSATSRSWACFRSQYKTLDSDTASTSSDIYPVRNTSHQMDNEMEDANGATSVITYVEPSPCVPVTTLLALPIHPLPVIVASDQAQVQLNIQKAAPAACDGSDEQLHRKHEELEQMIVQQQEELRQVKEQLLLARLGILQPFINVQNLYVNQEEMQQSQRLQPSNMVYEPTTPREEEQYMPPHQPSEHNTHHQDHID